MTWKLKTSPMEIGDTIGNLQIENIIATGSNCYIYYGKLNNGTVAIAIKTEIDDPNRTALSREAIVLKTVKNSNHFAKIIEIGQHGDYQYLATDILGPSIRDLTNRLNPPKLSLLTLLKFAYQAFEALQSLHQAGFIHRAVESKNFLIGYSKKQVGTIYLIDFSTCRKFNFNDTSRGNLQEQFKQAISNTNTNNASSQSISNMPSIDQLKNIHQMAPEDDLLGIMYIISEYYTGNTTSDFKGITVCFAQ
ncbi:MAG: hypothetical protein EZS28_019603 [Streblomastix strix]|uniref:Protein kinase domain-containing protein n=1 Tax=Streblomastix strix TaxID=222440 RepID=A0A5J4VQT9_9EUKA|nr:MAG: hypothetical protein EZS28_019603 [Streblomastix strix]